jgi:uncharacterized protein (DUF1330 family)
MDRRATLAIVALAALSLGTVNKAAAQAKTQAYYITDIAPADPEGWNKTYAPLVQPTFQPFGGHYIVRAGKTTTIAGDPPSRVVVIAFDSMEKTQAWLDSAAYKAILPTRAKFLGNGKYRPYIVEGVPN